jgi:signal transduction histidine kinase
MSQYNYLTIAEIRYVLSCGITGKYGQIYDRLDVAVIGAWFIRYDTERTLALEERWERESHNRAVGGSIFAPEIIDALKSAKDKAEQKDAERKAQRKAEKEKESAERKRIAAEQAELVQKLF